MARNNESGSCGKGLVEETRELDIFLALDGVGECFADPGFDLIACERQNFLKSNLKFKQLPVFDSLIPLLWQFQ
jgi:hypothetical protein